MEGGVNLYDKARLGHGKIASVATRSECMSPKTKLEYSIHAEECPLFGLQWRTPRQANSLSSEVLSECCNATSRKISASFPSNGKQ